MFDFRKYIYKRAKVETELERQVCLSDISPGKQHFKCKLDSYHADEGYIMEK